MKFGLLAQSPAASRSQSKATETPPPVYWLVSRRNSKYDGKVVETAGQVVPVGHAETFDQTFVVSPVPPDARIVVADGELAVAVATCVDGGENATFVFAVTAPAV